MIRFYFQFNPVGPGRLLVPSLVHPPAAGQDLDPSQDPSQCPGRGQAVQLVGSHLAVGQINIRVLLC